jgi:hypothetical protein
VSKLGPTEAMVLEAGKSGRGPWLTAAQIDFYDKMYARDVGKR